MPDNDDQSHRQSRQHYHPGPSTLPPNHQILAIIGILMCAPLGAVALIKSSYVHPRHRRGDFSGAADAAGSAKAWAIAAMIVGPILGVMCSGIQILQILSENNAL